MDEATGADDGAGAGGAVDGGGFAATGGFAPCFRAVRGQARSISFTLMSNWYNFDRLKISPHV